MQDNSYSRDLMKSGAYAFVMLLLLPSFSLWFFHQAESTYDESMRTQILSSIQQDAGLTPEQQQEAMRFFQTVPMSDILKSSDPQLAQLKSTIHPDAQFHYAIFRWMIRLSLFCILAVVVVSSFTGLSVAVSFRSQQAQYISLAVGWHVLRFFCTLQIIAQACLVIALSFWITALWFEVYFAQLIIISAIIAFGSVAPVIFAVFRRIDNRFEVRGALVERDDAPRFWDDLIKLSQAVGTAPPDQIIAGIDDNFFVTEHPVIVGDKVCRGRTLFVSLSLLKTLREEEASAVLIHELAHFSEKDTLFSKKISPLLARYHHYLHGLHEAAFLTRPVFHLAVLFRSLYETSLGKWNRQREFRADRVAAENISPADTVSALLRITAYAVYRQNIEQEFFEAEEAHQSADISARLEAGFVEFAANFADTADLDKLTTMHPFDSHPPLIHRMQALGFPMKVEAMREMLTEQVDGGWFHKISIAHELERGQWSEYEDQFRQFHENVLAFRYLPSDDAERELVEKYFPEIRQECYLGRTALLDCEKVTYEEWDEPLYYSDIHSMSTETELGKPVLNFFIEGGVRKLPLSKREKLQLALIQVVQQYAGRYAAAVDYQENLKKQDNGEAKNPP